jgi:hypothetical protein
MSYSFDARFSASSVPYATLLERLAATLPACGLRYSGAMMPLQSHGGWPTIGGLEFGHADTLAEAASVSASAWGVSFEFISAVLYDGLGKTDAMEVYLQVFRVSDDTISVIYNEASRAADYRIKDEDAARNLTAIQLAICDAGSFELSIYDEQNFKRPPIPTLRNVEVAIKRIADEPTRGDCSAVVSMKVLDLERARKLAGPRAGEIKVSTNGYIVFPFLRPAKG